MKKTWAFVSIGALLFSLPVFGQAGDTKALTRLLEPYQRSSGLESEIVKVSEQSLLGKTIESEGWIQLYKGRLKLKILKPEESQSLMVLNSKALWLEVPLGEGFPPSVTKISYKNFKRLEGIWSVILGYGKLENLFEVTQEPGRKFNLKPIKWGSSDLKSAMLDFKRDDLKSLEYTDQQGNRVFKQFYVSYKVFE